MGGEIGSRETLRQLPGDALIAVDIGNTSVKLAAFSFATLGPAGRTSQNVRTNPASQVRQASQDGLPEPLVMQEWPTGSGEFALAPDDLPPRPLSWTVSSVHRPACQNLVEWVATHRPRDTVKVLSYRDVPLAIDVDFPERVGLDRLATAVAADFLRSPSRPAIVIDAGTALKVHVVTADRRFVGGAILPGFRMSSAALRGNTDLLPLVPVSTNIEPPPVLGKNTEAAIRSGIYWGAVGAVRELVQRVKLELGVEPQVFITGGDARGLTSLIDHDTRYVPYLCLGGIALMAERPAVTVLTPAGRGAVATVGVWGPTATQLVQSYFQSASGRRLSETPLDRIMFGTWDGAEELVLARRGDERLEIHCHGGLAASEAIVESLVARGARRASPSEWLACEGLGRMEIEAAESLVRAQTERTAAILLDQYRGALRRELTELIELIEHVEPSRLTERSTQTTQTTPTARDEQASPSHAAELQSRLEQLVARAKLGVRLTDPWRVVLTGKPNVGKSSLINALLGYERAIVSDVPGTTRDVVTATTALDGWPITLADTAGRRATDEPLEASGIELADHRLSEADLVILVVDHDGPFDVEESAILARHPAALVVRNKCDLVSKDTADAQQTNSNAGASDHVTIRVSATAFLGLDILQAAIVTRLVPLPPSEHAGVPFTAEQLAHLDAALTAARSGHWQSCASSLQALLIHGHTTAPT